MFSVALHEQVLAKNSRLCVGLDPRLEWLPESVTAPALAKHGKTLAAAGEAILTFNRQVIEVVASLVPVIKPQLAFYEQYGIPGLQAFAETVKFAQEQGLLVIADAKRGDIDSTAEAYANAFLGKTKVFGESQAVFDVDALTVNPFLGEDSLLPFIKVCQELGKGIFVLVKTSNPGSQDIQALSVEGGTVTGTVAGLLEGHATMNLDKFGYSNIGAVVGATFPEEALELRGRLPHSIFLVPGLGAQGGDLSGLVNFFNEDKLGAVINSSREVVFSARGAEGPDYLRIIEEKTKMMVGAINRELGA